MLENACIVDNIVDGFVDVGMLDAKHKVWPDLDKIISTKRKDITKKEKDLIMNNFAKLFKMTLDEGHVPESVYNELGFSKDTVGNKVFLRDLSISAEWMQRSKEITHEFQHQLRQKRKEEMQQQVYEAVTKEREPIECLIETNQVVGEKLIM